MYMDIYIYISISLYIDIDIYMYIYMYNPLATRNRRLRWLSRCGQFTRIGGKRPLLREGGPISYEAMPSGSFQPGHGALTLWADGPEP